MSGLGGGSGGGSSGLQFVNGLAFAPDSSRGDKLLSVTRPLIIFATSGNNIVNRYLKVGDVVAFGGVGFLLPRDSTITAIWAKSKNLGAWTLQARKNDSTPSLLSLPVNTGTGQNLAANIDLNAGDCLQAFAQGSGIRDPIIAIELAWRITV